VKTAASTADNSQWLLLFSAWMVALVSTLGALFSSEIMGLEPCLLCWYQRIAMFPLALMLAIALLPFDVRVVRYALPLAIAGAGIAAYHCLLVWGVVPKDLVPCGQGPSCAEVKLNVLGFITLPLLSLVAFSLIVILLWILKSRNTE
jgi:disulfide bond formation protein DsbB